MIKKGSKSPVQTPSFRMLSGSATVNIQSSLPIVFSAISLILLVVLLVVSAGPPI